MSLMSPPLHRRTSGGIPEVRSSSRTGLIFGLIVGVVTVFAGMSVAHSEITGVGQVPADQPELGLRYAGLTLAKKDEPCYGGFRVAAADLCTHGPDAPPPGLAVDRGVAPVTMAATNVVCDGDGVTGQRVQVLYVRGAGTASHFAE